MSGNDKSELQHWAQTRGLGIPSYRTWSAVGEGSPWHASVQVGDLVYTTEPYPFASKKSAEAHVALTALTDLQSRENGNTRTPYAPSNPDSTRHSQSTAPTIHLAGVPTVSTPLEDASPHLTSRGQPAITRWPPPRSPQAAAAADPIIAQAYGIGTDPTAPRTETGKGGTPIELVIQQFIDVHKDHVYRDQFATVCQCAAAAYKTVTKKESIDTPDDSLQFCVVFVSAAWAFFVVNKTFEYLKNPESQT